MGSSYKDLEIYTLSYNLFIETHRFSLKLPQYELYELGSQLGRSSDSVNSNIVEGYGSKRYQKDFVRFLTYSQSSNDETINHLKKLAVLYPVHKEVDELINEYDLLGRKINTFIKYVEKNWKS